MKTTRNGGTAAGSWPESPEFSDHEQDLHSMKPEAPAVVSFPPANTHVPKAAVKAAPSSEDQESPSKINLPPPPGLPARRAAQIGRPWGSTIYDCGQHRANAIVTAFFPCVTFGQIAEIIDEGQTSCTLGSIMYILMAPALCSCWILGSRYRKKLRNKYRLVQAPAEDWVLHLFCPFCSLCQEFRELRSRGIDPSLGWMGFLAQQQEETLTTPPRSQAMII